MSVVVPLCFTQFIRCALRTVAAVVRNMPASNKQRVYEISSTLQTNFRLEHDFLASCSQNYVLEINLKCSVL